jgi:hypothetical protein
LESLLTQALNGVAQVEFSAILPAFASVPTEMQATQVTAAPAAAEFLATQQLTPVMPVEWFSVTLTDGPTAQLEFVARLSVAEPIPLENLSLAATSLTGTNTSAQIEFLGGVAGISAQPVEWLATWQVNGLVPLEALPLTQRMVSVPVEFGSPVFYTDLALPFEFAALFRVAEPAPFEASALLCPVDHRAAAEWLATALRPDAPVPLEFVSPVLSANFNVPFEFGGSLFVVMEPALLEWLASSATDRPVYIEWLRVMSADRPVGTEWLTALPAAVSNVPLEILASATTLSPALLEWLSIQILTSCYRSAGMERDAAADGCPCPTKRW